MDIAFLSVHERCSIRKETERQLQIIANKPFMNEVDHRMIISFFYVFEMWIGMNEFDHRILALLKQQRERPEKFKPDWGFKP